MGTAAKQSIMRDGKKSVPAGFEPARVSPKDHPKLNEFGDTLKCRRTVRQFESFSLTTRTRHRPFCNFSLASIGASWLPLVQAITKAVSYNARALARMKQTIRKNNAGYAEQIQAFKENPESPEESEEESEESDETDIESLDSEAEAERQFKTVRTGVAERPKDKILSIAPQEITYEMVQKKLAEVAAARGRATSLDRQDQVEMLTFLFGVARGAAQKIEVLVHKVTVIFDMNTPTSSPMTTANWKTCMASIFDLMSLVAENPSVKLSDNPVENDRKEEPAADEEITVWGNPAAFLERLDEEWTGSLKALDPHTNAYMDRLRDEAALMALSGLVSDYLNTLSDATRKMALAMKEAQEQPQRPTEEDVGEDGGDDSANVPTLVLPANFDLPEEAGGLMEELALIVYAYGNDNQKGNAMLYSVYFKSIHDDFYGARDMLLMSRISEQTQQLDIRMQILFNRTTAQLGLCAFRNGLINDAYSC
eukprot:jgi/Picre1/35049/NNA_002514.t1